MDNNKKTMACWLVYQHTTPSNKFYIGITSSNDPNERWKDGKGYSPRNKRSPSAFYKAILKYGWENITHEILYSNLTLEEASKKEKELIKSLREKHGKKSVYNIEDGGYYFSMSEETKKKISQANSGRIASEETKKIMSKNRQGKKAHGWGHYPSQKNKEDVSKKIKGIKRSQESKQKMATQKNKKVYMYDATGQFMQEFESAKKASEILNMNWSNISAVCRYMKKLYLGNFWSFEYIENKELIEKYIKGEIIIPKWHTKKEKRVNQLNENHEYIQTFDSIKQASEKTKIPEQQISFSCINNRIAGIYYWEFDTTKEKWGDTYFLYWCEHQEEAKKEKEQENILCTK